VSESSTLIPSAALEVLDSHYQYVKARINTATKRTIPGQKGVVAGMLNAQDWPPKEIKIEMFYMLVLGREPVGHEAYSSANPIKFHLVQWTWLVKGSDLQQGTRQAYRGDRYRIMQVMEDELSYGMTPNYAERQSWSLNASDVWVATSFSPKQFFTWTPVEFHETFTKDSGIAYGTGRTRLQDIPQPITA